MHKAHCACVHGRMPFLCSNSSSLKPRPLPCKEEKRPGEYSTTSCTSRISLAQKQQQQQQQQQQKHVALQKLIHIIGH